MKLRSRVFVFLCLGSLAACTAPASRPQLTVASGKLLGLNVEGVSAFRGIPYAAPPVGHLRWRPPQPPDAWSGTRDASQFGPTCAQPDSATLWFELGEVSEDCLTLNVITPELEPTVPLPVMVWIHGGGFLQGSGNLPRLNGTAIPSQGVLLVTVNYRLGPFGFLAHPVLAQPGDPVGNYGLLDVVAALQWVHQNIAAFGGDPGRVTIFGESAGADAVNYLMVMPAATGLFQRAISQSSSVGMAPTARLERRVGFNQPAEKIAEDYFSRLELSADLPFADSLRHLSADALLTAMTERDRFPAIVDGETVPDQAGLLFAAGRQQKVPYITGGNSWEASLGRMIGGGFSPEFAARLVPATDQARLYPGLEGTALEDTIFGDLIILSHSRYLADQMRAAGLPVYRYYLTYVAEARRAGQPGAAHGDDIAFVMGSLDAEADLPRVSERDRVVSKLMNAYWVNFARSGNPNGPGLPEWPLYRTAQGAVLEIGEDFVVREPFLDARMEYHLGRGRVLLERSR